MLERIRSFVRSSSLHASLALLLIVIIGLPLVLYTLGGIRWIFVASLVVLANFCGVKLFQHLRKRHKIIESSPSTYSEGTGQSIFTNADTSELPAVSTTYKATEDVGNQSNRSSRITDFETSTDVPLHHDVLHPLHIWKAIASFAFVVLLAIVGAFTLLGIDTSYSPYSWEGMKRSDRRLMTDIAQIAETATKWILITVAVVSVIALIVLSIRLFVIIVTWRIRFTHLDHDGMFEVIHPGIWWLGIPDAGLDPISIDDVNIKPMKQTFLEQTFFKDSRGMTLMRDEQVVFRTKHFRGIDDIIAIQKYRNDQVIDLPKRQNELLEEQNQKLDRQNELLEEQNQLLHRDRPAE